MFYILNLFIFKISIRKRQSSIHEYIIIYKHLSNINQSLNWHWFVLKHAFGDLCSGTTYSTVRLLADSSSRYLLVDMRNTREWSLEWCFCAKDWNRSRDRGWFRGISHDHLNHPWPHVGEININIIWIVTSAHNKAFGVQVSMFRFLLIFTASYEWPRL